MEYLNTIEGKKDNRDKIEKVSIQEMVQPFNAFITLE